MLTVKEVAVLEDLSVETMLKRIQRGKLKAAKIDVQGRRDFEYRITLSDVSKAGLGRYYARIKAAGAEQLRLTDYPLAPKDYKGLTLLNLTGK